MTHMAPYYRPRPTPRLCVLWQFIQWKIYTFPQLNTRYMLTRMQRRQFAAPNFFTFLSVLLNKLNELQFAKRKATKTTKKDLTKKLIGSYD